jgi:polyribonucleotide nucleotidyltransferase
VKLVALQNEIRREVGVPKRQAPTVEIPPDLQREVEGKISEPLWNAMKIRDKIQSYRQISELEKELVGGYPEEAVETRSLVKAVFHDVHRKLARNEIIEKGARFDDRGFEEIRPITAEVGLLPRTHGSALFTRGETQALVTTTLGTSEDAQTLDWLEGESERRFMLHYNFPPFSVGEVKFLRGPGRREIGHGALAERAIRPMMPGTEEFPYTIRLVSDILESNGSSSMASICGGSLCLMDAGVPLKAAVGGIAMGLVKEGDRYVILSDIAGSEDHYGDMDFKVAGTRKGITALQMDIKVQGLSREILEKALGQAHRGRMHILGVMDTALASPREAISAYAPRIFSIRVPKDKIREVIGPGGKMIRSIIERTGCKIDIDDDGKVDIASIDEASALKAIEIIKEITAEAEIGKTYLGKVIRVVAFGAFVEILPGIEGLLHISEIAEHRVKEVTDVDGDRIRLSRKAVLREKKGEAGASDPSDPPRQVEHRHAGRPHRRSR